MLWSQSEIRAFLDLIDDDEGGIDRGSIGQTVFLLLYQDSAIVEKLIRFALHAAAEDPDLAGWAAYLAVAKVEDQAALWADMVKEQPLLEATFIAPQISDALFNWGFVSLE